MREGLLNFEIDIIKSSTPIIPIYTYYDIPTFVA